MSKLVNEYIKKGLNKSRENISQQIASAIGEKKNKFNINPNVNIEKYPAKRSNSRC